MLEKLEKIVEAIESKKGEELIILDFQGENSVCDYAVICTGSSNRNVRAISEEVEVKLMEFGERRLNIEGQDEAHWVLIDGDDVMIHVLDQKTRDLYRLEELWGYASVIFPRLDA
ncbi:MAG: ribosome silencing factor [Psychrilyobacter sp.]|uniref:ribosome silencing factor n=1 Tax=Psychrilyobacter sp. TaxID=2586924 RepID=UPI003C76FF6F